MEILYLFNQEAISKYRSLVRSLTVNELGYMNNFIASTNLKGEPSIFLTCKIVV